MKCNYRVNPDLMLELEGANQKELFQAMAEAAEIFGAWQCCGKCRTVQFKPRPVVRKNKKNQQFYELHCTNPQCGARFVFGQSQDMKTLFPQRKFPKDHPKANTYKPDGGWMVWVREEDDGAE